MKVRVNAYSEEGLRYMSVDGKSFEKHLDYQIRFH